MIYKLNLFLIILFLLLFSGCSEEVSSFESEIITNEKNLTIQENLSLEENIQGIIQFYDPNCPHCMRLKDFNSKLLREFPELEIREFDIRTSQGQEILQFKIQTIPNLSSESIGVPITIIAQDYIIGFRDENTTGRDIITLIEKNSDYLNITKNIDS